MGLYALWGPMQVAAGPITPLIFLAAMLMTLPTAISYALLNREAPSAGAASTWLWTAVHPLAGFLAGLLMTTYFAMAAIAQPLMFALFFHDLLDWLHLTWPQPVTLTVGVLLASAPVAWVCLRGAEASIKTTVQLMAIETLVVVALSATILITKSAEPGAITLSAFNPHQASSLSGFWGAMILGVLAFCGFDVVSTAAEEAYAPREHLPKAILLTIVGIAIFWAINAWVFTLSTPVEKVNEYTNHGTCLFWRFARSQFRVLANGVLPLLGVLLNAYLLYAAFFRTLWLGSVRTGKSVVVVCMALLVVQVGALIYVRLFRPCLLTQGTPIGVDALSQARTTYV